MQTEASKATGNHDCIAPQNAASAATSCPSAKKPSKPCGVTKCATPRELTLCRRRQTSHNLPRNRFCVHGMRHVSRQHVHIGLLQPRDTRKSPDTAVGRSRTDRRLCAPRDGARRLAAARQQQERLYLRRGLQRLLNERKKRLNAIQSRLHDTRVVKQQPHMLILPMRP